MVVYYHGAMPIDVYYLTCWLRVNLRVCARPVVDYFMFKVPGFRDFLENFGATTGPRENLVELLKKGNVVIISPGGVREALFSKDYEIIWVIPKRLRHRKKSPRKFPKIHRSRTAYDNLDLSRSLSLF